MACEVGGAEEVVRPMSHGFQVRLATLQDENAVSALLETSYPALMRQHYDRDLLSAALPALIRASPELLQSGTYYVAESRSLAVIGCGGWTRERPGRGDVEAGLGHIRHFATHPDWLGRAVGRSIYEVCERHARSFEVTRFECYSSLNAEGFYAALGFELVRRVNVPLGPDLALPGVLMRCTI